MKKILVDESVLKQAIEAFVHMCHNTNATRGYNSRIVSDAMNTLGAALSQQEQEPVWDASAPWARAAISKVTEQPKESLPDNCNIYLHMECVECGHYQTVRGHRHNGHNYFGSGYDFCDKCGGLPEPY